MSDISAKNHTICFVCNCWFIHNISYC